MKGIMRNKKVEGIRKRGKRVRKKEGRKGKGEGE